MSDHLNDTASLASEKVTPAPAIAFPSLIEGNNYIVEFIDDETCKRAKLIKFVEQPCGLGWGATFEIGKKRRFVYLRDIHSVVGNRVCVMGGL